MAGVITEAGLSSLAAYNGTVEAWLDTLTMHLFINNHTPTVTDTAADYTEATFPGYAAQGTTGWTAPGIDASDNYQFSHSDVTWTSTGTSTDVVYGYYWTDVAGDVVAAEIAAASFAMSAAGLSYTVSPNFYLGQLAGTP